MTNPIPRHAATPRVLALSAALVCSASAVSFAQLAAPPAPAESSQAADATCVPSCRAGFVCLSGQCVSACNPACAPNETCTAHAECIPAAGFVTAPPAGFPPPAAYPPPPGPPQLTYVPPLPPPPDPGAHNHDGLLLRMQLGFSSVRLALAPGITMSGVGSAVDLTAGRVVAPGLVVGAAFYHSAGGVSAVDGVNPPDLSAIMLGFGPTVVYYLPSNYFVGAAAGGSVLYLRDLRNSNMEITWSTGLGVSAKAEVGREWWVSDNWGLGASLRFHYMRAKETDAGPFAPVWSGGGLSVLFSATYN